MFLPSLYQLKTNQRLSKLLSNGFERSKFWNEHETKSENQVTTNEYGHFLKPNFVGANRLFVLIYSKENNDAKRYHGKK